MAQTAKFQTIPPFTHLKFRFPPLNPGDPKSRVEKAPPFAIGPVPKLANAAQTALLREQLETYESNGKTTPFREVTEDEEAPAAPKRTRKTKAATTEEVAPEVAEDVDA